MKAHDENCDEMLNSFVDGELSARQRTEVKRLAAHDQDVAGRIRRIKNGRNLLRLLPREEPPAEIYENVRTLLERKSLLGERSLAGLERRPKRYMVLRKVRAAAAVLLLIGGLGFLVYHIMAPLDGTPEPITRPIPIGSTGGGAGTPTQLHSTYTLHVAAATDLATELDQVINNHDLDNKVVRQKLDGREVYRFTCAKRDLAGVLTRLRETWGAVNDAQLVLNDGSGESQVVVQQAKPTVLASILSQASTTESLGKARQLAALGAVPPYAADHLAGPNGASADPRQSLEVVGEEQVHFTIEVIHDGR